MLAVVWLALASWVGQWVGMLVEALLAIFFPFISDVFLCASHLMACILFALSGTLIACAYASCMRSIRALCVAAVLCSTMAGSALLSAATLSARWRWVVWLDVLDGLPGILPGLLAVGSFAGFHLAAAELLDLVPRRRLAFSLRLIGIVAVACAGLALLGAEESTWLLFAATGAASLFGAGVSLVVVSRVDPYPQPGQSRAVIQPAEERGQ